MPVYEFRDDQYSEIHECEDIDEARNYAIDSWKSRSWDTKSIVAVNIYDIDGDFIESVDVPVGDDPKPPACIDRETHDWCSPIQIVGGLRENPGVWSVVGTRLIIRQVCRYCGVYKVEHIVGSQNNFGECDTIEYENPNETSLRWVQ